MPENTKIQVVFKEYVPEGECFKLIESFGLKLAYWDASLKMADITVPVIEAGKWLAEFRKQLAVKAAIQQKIFPTPRQSA